MTGNWIEINGIQIAVSDGLSIAVNSPLDDSSFVYVNGNKVSETGEQGFEIELSVRADQLSALGMPQLLQKQFGRDYIENVSLYSDGTLVSAGSLFITGTDYDANTKSVKCQGLFFNFASTFVNSISTRKVNQLSMGGVRVIDGLTNYLSGPVLPDVSVHRAPVIIHYNESNPSSSDPRFNIIPANSLGADLFGTATADYATQVTLNGDPGADGNGDILCFPSLMIIDNSNGNTFVNGWDPVNKFYPSVYTQADTSGIFNINPNYYQDIGAHIVPMYYYHQVIRHCFSDFGYTLIDADGLLSDTHFRRLVLVNNFDILNAITVSLMSQDKTVTTTVGYFQRSTVINPVNHLPSDLILDFLKDFMIKFNCYFEIGSNTATLKRSKFKATDREISDYDPHFSIHPTLERGMTASYKLSDDKQYANISLIPELPIHGTDQQPFAAGFNKVYTYPEGDPLSVVISPGVQDLYYAILNLSNNTLNYRIAGNPAGSYTQLLTTDNVLPITIGIYTRDDSPSVNLFDIDNTTNKTISLLYPPVSQVPIGAPEYNNPAIAAQPVSSQLTFWLSGTYGTGLHVAISSSGDIGADGSHVILAAVFSIIIPTQLILPVGLSINLIADIQPDSTAYATSSSYGSLTFEGHVESYNNATGELVFTTSFYRASWLNLSSTWAWNKWTLTYLLPVMPSVGGTPAMMQVPVSAFQTPELLFQVGSVGARPQDIGLIQQTYDNSVWSQTNNNNIWMPESWSKRSGSTVVESGFYWGVQQSYAKTIHNPPPYYEISDMVPVLTGFERIIGNTAVPIGWFNLSLHGPFSLTVVFWTPFLNQYLFNIKVNFTAHESLRTTMGHDFSKAVLWRGRRIYISQIDKILPYRGAGIPYQGYVI